MPVSNEAQVYLNFVDSGQFDIFCTIKETDSFVMNLVTLIIPEHTCIQYQISD